MADVLLRLNKTSFFKGQVKMTRYEGRYNILSLSNLNNIK